MRQLKTTEVAAYRRNLANKQRYFCPICKETMAGEVGALDHCHETGLVRAALCKTCNVAEGKVKWGSKYMAKKSHPVWTNYIEWLRSLADYLEYHRDNPSSMFHPSWDVKKGKPKVKKRRKKKL